MLVRGILLPLDEVAMATILSSRSLVNVPDFPALFDGMVKSSDNGERYNSFGLLKSLGNFDDVIGKSNQTWILVSRYCRTILSYHPSQEAVC